MLGKSDQRIVELKFLENLAEGTWGDGVCTSVGAGQTTALGLSEYLYADMLVTLYEDGYLKLTEGQIISKIDNSERVKTRAFRNEAVSWLSVSPHFHYASITYRGLRRIDELRDQLRRDRILEKFGILLDGRYITPDLIYFLERADGEPVSLLLGDVDDFKQFNSDYGYKAGMQFFNKFSRLSDVLSAIEAKYIEEVAKKSSRCCLTADSTQARP